jgi:hypothetical protein
MRCAVVTSDPLSIVNDVFRIVFYSFSRRHRSGSEIVHDHFADTRCSSSLVIMLILINSIAWSLIDSWAILRRCVSCTGLLCRMLGCLEIRIWTVFQRSARAEILEFHPARPEEHLSRARTLSSNMLLVPHLSPTSFYSNPNEARSICNCPDYSIINTFLF